MDIEPLLDQLRVISNDELLDALCKHKLVIPTDKFATAFQCVGACHELSIMEVRPRGQPGISDLAFRGARLRAGIVFMVFTTLCYMRSEHLERGLDRVPLDSPLRPFRDIYRAGKIKLGEDTLVQHIRNSLAHGSFQLGKAYEVNFTDRSWQETLPIPQLRELCEHVHRLYHEAFNGSVPRPPHWSKYSKN